MIALMLTLLLALPGQGFDPDPENTARRWLVVYNSNWSDDNGNGMGDSEELARFYAAKRGIPLRNLIGVACSTGSSYYYYSQTGWEAFWDEMVEPLRTAISSAPEDYVLGMVFCYGVPYKLSVQGSRGLDTTLMWLWDLGTRATPKFMSYGDKDVYKDAAPGFGTDPGRFDPATHRTVNDNRTYLVARLDGLDLQHSMELVEQALYGDAYISSQPGYYTGTAYCDTRYGLYSWADLIDYPYSHNQYGDADKDMAYGRQWMEQAGFTLQWEPYGTEIGESGAQWESGQNAETAPDALWYEGWYNYVTYHDVWEWKVGSAACDLNSNSIASFRSTSCNSFLGNALQRGLTCGPGCIGEPYLNGHPFPEVFIYYLLNGYPFAEAARVSDPKAKWTQVYIGDPLYQPTLDGKVPLLDDQPPPPCEVSVELTATQGERRFSTALDTGGFLPDLGTLTLNYGATPDYGSTVTGEHARARLFHTTLISGLSADELMHYRADYTDPAGLTGPGEDLILHTALETQPVLARAYASDTTVPAGTPFALEIVLGAQDGFASLDTYSATITAAHMGWQQLNILPYLAGASATRYDSADDSVVAARIGDLVFTNSGSYTFEVSASNATGNDYHSVTIDVN